MKVNKVIIIGFGHHAKRIHFPIINNLPDAEIVGIVDLKSQKNVIEGYLTKNRIKIQTLYLENNSHDLKNLTSFARNNAINAVVISTGPEVHFLYTKWAFTKGLHVILDKPIHVQQNAAHNISAAEEINLKFDDLLDCLKKARLKYPNLVCEVLTQRRFHPAYKLIKETVDEIYQKTSCPITYYYAFHNDGQWRMPKELIDIEYHGYKNGYGKASHSGYHFYDLLNWFSSGFRKQEFIDSILVKSWANFPDNYLKQIKPAALARIFHKNNSDYNIHLDRLKNYGEIDVMSTIRLNSHGNTITHAQIDLLHSGLSSRSWPSINNRNLYKGNGRIRHEQHYLNIGPFASLSLTSWQVKPFNSEEINNKDIYKPGHEFNLDVSIFRNHKIIGGKDVESFSIKDIYNPVLNNYSRGHQEDARRNAFIEFFKLIKESKNAGQSSLELHALSNLILTDVYKSIASQKAVLSDFRED